MEALDYGEQATSYFFRAVPQLNEIDAPIPLFSFNNSSKQRDTATQFQLLKELTDTKRHRILLHKTSAEQRVLNRYRDEKIFDHSRVKLQKKIEDRFKDIDYINANIVFTEPYKMILTQGPKPGTIKDFYMMLKQEQTQYVVMLCNLKQQGKTKCQNYFSGFNDYKLIQTKQISNNIILRTLKDQQSQFTFKHIHYTGWDDHSTPSKYEDITTIMDLIDTSKGVTIHCSAGIGRSGTLAVIMKCVEQISRNKISVFACARKIRENRYGSIKNSQQYEFIYDYLRSYIQKHVK